MKQSVEEVKQELLSKIPHQDKPLPLSELQKASVPESVLDAIRYNASEKLLSTIKIPKTDWANTDSDLAEKSWLNYIESLRNSLQIPADQIEKVMTEAVKLSLNLAVKPLKTIPKTIFKSDKQLERNVIQTRGSRIHIHKHLVIGLVRYMEKRSIDKITVEKAGQIIKKIDKKLTENFTALDWAEYSRPLFELAGPNVNSNLLRQFFEERGEKRIARKFESMDMAVSESSFVVALSSSDLLDTTGYDEEQPSLFKPEKDVEAEKEEKVEPESEQTVEKETEAEEPNVSESLETKPWDEDEQEEEKTFADQFIVEDESDEKENEPESQQDDEKKKEVEELKDSENLETKPWDEHEPERDKTFADQFIVEDESDTEEDEPELEASDDEKKSSILVDGFGERVDDVLDEEVEADDTKKPKDKSEPESEFSETEWEEEKKQDIEEEQKVKEETRDEKPKEFELDPDKISISEEYSYRGTNVTDDEDELDEDDDETPLHSRFIFDVDNIDDDEENEEPSTIYDEMNLVQEDSDDLDEKKSVLSLFEPLKEDEIEDTPVDENTIEDEEQSAAEKPEEAIEIKQAKQEENRPETTEEQDVSMQESEPETTAKPETEPGKDDESKITGFLSEEIDEDDEDLDDVPMWKSFLEQEDLDEDDYDAEDAEKKSSESSIYENIDDEDEVEEGFLDEPVIDLTKDEEQDVEKVEVLEEWLSDDRQRFVNSIFSGSDMAYESALSEIINFDNWKSAYQYIEKEIFSRNLVDIYDEDAVDFTDRLQNYFDENKS